MQGLILRASKFDALELMGSAVVKDRILALQKLLEDPCIDEVEEAFDYSCIVLLLESLAAEMYAR